ncbi:phospholipase D-like domain-containing protein [Variovorax sp. PAMC28562]|uniref:phospholipase D-like domain-containing protein n=1 Tax=Variovorax sp. PAMC28562 TaxID=2762323 RepID=UPI0021C25B9B|nr:phospholipase D-like domain-containing protein [Variovorax sp. PAMC28562]
MANPPDTQHKSVTPLSDVSRHAAGSVQWLLETKDDAKTPVFHYNNLSVYICGKDSFERIAQDIQTAEETIDIVAWGFDPAMELNRKAGQWGQRGVTYGDLLRDATQGKLKSKKKVKVRLLVWRDDIGVAIGGENMPGYKQSAGYEANAASWRSATKGYGQAVERPSLPESANVQDQREVFNSHWYSDVVTGKIEGLSLRTRDGVNADVVGSLKAEAKAGASALGGLERTGLEMMATHHQKTIVIDYEGSHPRAYVMGLNSVTDYWDTAEHVFNDLKRGQNFEGDDKDHSVGKDWKSASSGQPTLKPYQDFVCRIEGDAVVAVYKNFVDGWNKATGTGKGAGSPISGQFDVKAAPARLTQNLTAACSRAQILRTLPDKDGGERSIERLYYQASSFARHYLYIENQYFQNTDWAHALKTARQKFVEECAAAKPRVALADIPVLHVMVVIPTPERGLMVPRTHDTVTELGQGDSMPNQDKNVRKELADQSQSERDMADYENRRKAYDTQHAKDVSYLPYASIKAPPYKPAPLSAMAQSLKDAGGAKESQATRDLLSKSLGMRTLVASLWTYDDKWNQDQLPVAKRIEEEKKTYALQKKEWEERPFLATARAGDRQPTTLNPPLHANRPDPGFQGAKPPDRSKELQNATAQRYREIYIHSKLMVIDDSMFTLGSANLNLRSFAVDSEINIASDDADKAKDLRQRVWNQHTKGQFDGGGDATEQTVMLNTFTRWEKEAIVNSDNKEKGKSLSSFLVKFLDERTSTFRAG